MKPTITLAQAKKLSTLKWELIVKNYGEFSYEDKRNPKLRVLKHFCGFCERWKDGSEKFNTSGGCNCSKCEFAKAVGAHCNEDESLFDNWGSTASLTLAKEILDIIKNIPTTKKQSDIKMIS